MLFTHCIFSLELLYLVHYVHGFRDATADVFRGDNLGVISAFGDLNSDKLIDIFRVSPDFHTLEFLIATGTKPSFETSQAKCTVPGIITSVMPGDFDGDSVMDVLVTIATESTKPSPPELECRILWGRLRMGIDCTNITRFTVTHQPLLFDFNANRIVDVLSAKPGNKTVRTVWSFTPNRTIIEHELVSKEGMAKPHSNSYIDINEDMTADLVITGETEFELYLWSGNGSFLNPRPRSYPQDSAIRGQSVFVDVNADGDLEHIMPVCIGNSDCRRSVVMVHNGTSWVPWLEDLKDPQNQTWRFHHESEKAGLEVPVMLRSGDVDMDGYPDFLVVLEGRDTVLKKKVRRVIVLLNSDCPWCPYGRKLMPYWNYGALGAFSHVHLATFFDIDEDGLMDILLVNGSTDAPRIHALKSQFSDDACFIKVLTVSGLCYRDCPMGQIAYGTNQPGPTVRYRTTKSDGFLQEGCMGQLSQSAHFSLQLPYVVFGLGQSPNFVDVLLVALPSNSSLSHPSIHHQWTQIIPNSQMVVIPYPRDSAQKWVNKLFVTPGRQVFITFVALAGTCVFCALIICGFHYVEKREDRRVKHQERQLFHFDAM